MDPKRNLPISTFDTSVWFLLGSNLFSIYFALTERWGLEEILLLYLLQTFIIGIFNVVRILQLKDFSTSGYVEKKSTAVPDRQAIKERMALIFALHFGIFLVTYTLYLIPNFTLLMVKGAIIPASVFFMNHAFSYFYNKRRDFGKPSIGIVTFLPYVRILPMHIVLLYAFTTNGSVVIFLALKTIADVVMHMIEHKFLRSEEEVISL